MVKDSENKRKPPKVRYHRHSSILTDWAPTVVLTAVSSAGGMVGAKWAESKADARYAELQLEDIKDYDPNRIRRENKISDDPWPPNRWEMVLERHFSQQQKENRAQANKEYPQDRSFVAGCGATALGTVAIGAGGNYIANRRRRNKGVKPFENRVTVITFDKTSPVQEMYIGDKKKHSIKLQLSKLSEDQWRKFVEGPVEDSMIPFAPEGREDTASPHREALLSSSLKVTQNNCTEICADFTNTGNLSNDMRQLITHLEYAKLLDPSDRKAIEPKLQEIGGYWERPDERESASRSSR